MLFNIYERYIYLEDVLKDITSFLEEELNNTIDEISEIKT